MSFARNPYQYVRRLLPRAVERPWGRSRLPHPFESQNARVPIGEIWFEPESGPLPGLLIKYLFTSERLSIQVHPGDADARRLGLACGKDEAWLILEAGPGSSIGLGLRDALSAGALVEAARDGSIVDLIDWRPVRAGSFFYSPAGTVHAIGAGISLVEIQQECDVTYRLHDYGRGRDLHIETGASVADLGPFSRKEEEKTIAPGRIVMAEGGAFVVERWTGPMAATIEATEPVTLVPLVGGGAANAEPLLPGSVFVVEGHASLVLDADAQALAAYRGTDSRPHLLRL